MMNKNKKNNKNGWLVGVFIVLSFILFFPHGANAATLNLFSSKDTLVIGDEFNIDLKIDSEGVGINAAQATLQYSKDIVTVTKVDKTDSVFNFWLAEPSFDNTAGTVNLIGGSITGISGKSLQVLKVTFKVKGSGVVSLNLNDAAVTASDGSGTNVLTATKGIELSSLSKVGVDVIVPKLTNPTPEIAPNAPAKPILSVPLYPDPLKWNDVSSNFSVSWNLPKDVIAVSTALDKIPSLNPTTGEGLFDNKSFPPLGNGIWYLHVRFKNNIGWGSTNNYKIAIDTQPPLAFEVVVDSGGIDNPTPTVVFGSKDTLSGIDYYSIQIDKDTPVTATQNSFTTGALPPGKHSLKVIAHDKAGNTQENIATIDIAPISSPEILSTTKNVFLGEGGIAISGSSKPGITILANLKDLKNQTIYTTSSVSNAGGFWSIAINQPVKMGTYHIEVTAKDERGALSLPVLSDVINLKELPVFSIGSFSLSYKWFLIISIIVLLGAFVAGFFTNKLSKESRQRRILIAQRDVNSQLLNIQKDIAKIIEKHKAAGNISDGVENEVDYLLKKIDENINKNKGYVLENLEEIG